MRIMASDFGLQWAACMFECFRYFDEPNFLGFASFGKWFVDAILRCFVRGDANKQKVVNSPNPEMEHLIKINKSLYEYFQNKPTDFEVRVYILLTL